MKRIFTVALVLLASVTMSIGQSRPALRVDANFVGSNQSMKRDGYVWNTKMNVGLRVGAAAEFMIGSRGFYLAPGLNYTMKGSKSEWDIPKMEFQSTYITMVSTRLHYLQLPINAGIRFDLMNDMAVSIEAGPFLAYGIYGTYRQKLEGWKPNNYSTEFFGPTLGGPTNIRWDIGANIIAAFHYKRYYIQIGCEYGFVDIVSGGGSDIPRLNDNRQSSSTTALREKGNNEYAYNRDFFVGIGYRF
ncbi:membrane protein [Porphyromonas gingivalis]|uniref:outer membrane beta-barrel protein n=1 Tax=Porphyromonas gingivalis TaxID=837 RepID=UPI00097501ED|nr:outer membrane beta-barrel protein [Porphyromonas gingivalis]SJL26509.1 membrane protein [Porphyromonas gingivalis]